MSTFPGSPPVLKGAIVGMDPLNPLASIVIFQYNPDTMTRTISAQSAGGSTDREGPLITGGQIIYFAAHPGTQSAADVAYKKGQAYQGCHGFGPSEFPYKQGDLGHFSTIGKTKNHCKNI